MSEITALVQRLREELIALELARPFQPVAPAVVEAAAQHYGLPPSQRELLLALGQHGLSLLPGPYQELTLFAAPELERAQVGFRGPRLGDDSFVAPHGWRRGWVVIAADSGDPYFLDVSRVTKQGECAVYTAMHGTGAWDPLLAASSVEQFLRILLTWTRIVAPHHDRQNPDEPLDEAHARRLALEIERIDPAAAPQWAV